MPFFRISLTDRVDISWAASPPRRPSPRPRSSPKRRGSEQPPNPPHHHRIDVDDGAIVIAITITITSKGEEKRTLMIQKSHEHSTDRPPDRSRGG
jgi:hypothetical protein